MEDADVIEVHMEQIGGGIPTDIDEEWLLVDVEAGDRIAQRTESEMARLAVVKEQDKMKNAVTVTNSTIRLSIGAAGEEGVIYKIRQDAILDKAFRKYAKTRGLSKDEFSWWYEGKKLNGDESGVVVSIDRVCIQRPC